MRARGQRRKASSLGDLFDLQQAEESLHRNEPIAKDFLLPSKRIGIMDWNGFPERKSDRSFRLREPLNGWLLRKPPVKQESEGCFLTD